MSFTLTITTSGLDALVDAQNGSTDPIQVTEIGLSATAVTPAPTLSALPGEIKRIGSISGTAISETVIHMTAQDSSSDVYDLRSFALYLADGTLFAVYGQATPIVSKAAVLNLQLAFDVAFQDGIAGDIEFGDATFLFPPATETIKGVAEIATQAEVDEGTDDSRFVTPLKLAARLAVEIALRLAGDNALAAQIAAEITARQNGDTTLANQIAAEITARQNGDTTLNNLIAALAARTITGSGLASGGGDLSANRVIAVAASSGAELQAATLNTKAVTPASFGALPRVRGASGYEVLPGGTLIQSGRNRVGTSTQQVVSLSFPIAFANTDYDLQVTPVIGSAGDFDNFLQEIDGTRTTTGVQLFSQDASSGGSSALAGFNWRAEGVI